MHHIRARRPLNRQTIGHVGRFDDVGQDQDVFKKPDVPTTRLHVLGYKHWIGMFLLVALVYAVAHQGDCSYPPIVDGGDFEHFSEVRTRALLKQLIAKGPRTSGSDALEIHATQIIFNELRDIERVGGHRHRIEIDEQRPSGCFDLEFLSDFTLCYQNVTNIVARIGPKSVKQAEHSLLVNCHFDSMPDALGATDDAVSCATMIDILHVLARNDTSLPYDIVFLFNGAEENFMQGAHGFITQHPWRHTIRAAVNLEGAGAGGRELLFQAGPQNAWLINTYLTSAPHPHCSILAQEVFQSGVVPSDTDYRIFRDYGRVPGIDIAYVRNGWVYHTEFDDEKYIKEGAIQRAGENALGLVRGLISSPHLTNASINARDATELLVFFDIWGMFTVQYGAFVSHILNYGTVLLVVCKVIANVVFGDHRQSWDAKLKIPKQSAYGLRMLLASVAVHVACFMSIIVMGGIIVIVIGLTNCTLVWYATPSLLVPLYVLPMLAAALALQSKLISSVHAKRDPFVAERCHSDAAAIIMTLVLVMLLANGIQSAFYVMLLVTAPMLRPMWLYVISFIARVDRHPIALYTAHVLSHIPVIVMASYGVFMMGEIFVPIMGRAGQAVNPDIFIMVIMAMPVIVMQLFTSSLMYISRNITYLLKCIGVVIVVAWALILTTRIGYPYQDDADGPRFRRMIILHTNRQVFAESGELAYKDQGLWYVAQDARGAGDLPEHGLVQGGVQPPCDRLLDLYCDLPFYGPTHKAYQVEHSRWVSVPTSPKLAFPNHIEMTGKRRLDEHTVEISLLARGTDHMSLHVTPVNGWLVDKWSFSTATKLPEDVATHFVFLAAGGLKQTPWTFSITLRHPSAHTAAAVDAGRQVRLSVISHYVHGVNQRSPLLETTVALVKKRRQALHATSTSWKWAITPLAGNAEVLAKWF